MSTHSTFLMSNSALTLVVPRLAGHGALSSGQMNFDRVASERFWRPGETHGWPSGTHWRLQMV